MADMVTDWHPQGAEPVGADPAELALLYDRHADALYDMCLSLVGDPDLAGAAVRRTFETASGQRPPQKLTMATWLYATARVEAMGVRDRCATPLDPARPAAQQSSGIEPAALRGLILAAIKTLPERDRLLLDLHLRHRLSDDVLAVVVGQRQRRVEASLRRLRNQLEDDFGALLVIRLGRQQCDQLDTLLMGWDGSYSSAISDAVQQHVDDCPTCAACRRNAPRPIELLADVPLATAPPILRRVVLGSLAATVPPKDPAPARAQPAAPAGPAAADATAAGATAAGTAGSGTAASGGARAGRHAKPAGADDRSAQPEPGQDQDGPTSMLEFTLAALATPGAETPGAETPGAETPGAGTPGAESDAAEAGPTADIVPPGSAVPDKAGPDKAGPDRIGPGGAAAGNGGSGKATAGSAEPSAAGADRTGADRTGADRTGSDSAEPDSPATGIATGEPAAAAAVFDPSVGDYALTVSALTEPAMAHADLVETGPDTGPIDVARVSAATSNGPATGPQRVQPAEPDVAAPRADSATVPWSPTVSAPGAWVPLSRAPAFRPPEPPIQPPEPAPPRRRGDSLRIFIAVLVAIELVGAALIIGRDTAGRPGTTSVGLPSVAPVPVQPGPGGAFDPTPALPAAEPGPAGPAPAPGASPAAQGDPNPEQSNPGSGSSGRPTIVRQVIEPAQIQVRGCRTGQAKVQAVITASATITEVNLHWIDSAARRVGVTAMRHEGDAWVAQLGPVDAAGIIYWRIGVRDSEGHGQSGEIAALPVLAC